MLGTEQLGTIRSRAFFTNGVAQLFARLRRVIVVAATLATVATWGATWVAAQEAPQEAPTDAEVRKLVARLGDDEFAIREEAQRKLELHGIDAFDVLREAKDDPDIEISRRVRYLLRRLDVVWYEDSDSPNVKAILEKYSSLGKIERATRIDALASLPIDEGIPVLCRIARLETEDRLSKRAAVALIKAKYFGQPPEERKKIARQIEKVTIHGKRKSMVWLRTFAESLPDPKATVGRWREIVAEERKNYANYPATSSNQILLTLVRFETETMLLVDDRAAAVKSARQAGELVDGKRHELLTHVDWLLDRKFPELVVTFAALHPLAFDEGLGLRYRLAEAHRKAGAVEEAEKTATAALTHRADDLAAHLEVASQLESRGMHDWAEAEYRFVGEGNGENLIFSFRARVSLSEMLHDQSNDFGSATTLQTVFDEIDNDPKKLEVFRLFRPSPNVVRSRMQYFYFLMYEKKEDVERQKKALDEGFVAYPDDVDLLIGIYRFGQNSGDDSFRAIAKQRIEASTARHLQRARDQEGGVRNPAIKGQSVDYLAHFNNQYAWLVANTIGDYDEALRRSRQSVDMMPDASGYWDTLGRCYFAIKDYPNAVKFQEHAASMEPHSGLIKLQLATFKEALAREQAANGEKPVAEEAEEGKGKS